MENKQELKTGIVKFFDANKDFGYLTVESEDDRRIRGNEGCLGPISLDKPSRKPESGDQVLFTEENGQVNAWYLLDDFELDKKLHLPGKITVDLAWQIVSINKELFDQMEQLNYRVGQKIFKAVGLIEIIEQVKGLLNEGFSEKRILKAAKLPPLDPEMVTKIEKDYPSDIEIGGARFPLVFHSDYVELVLPVHLNSEQIWQHLPDEGLYYKPDHRPIRITVDLTINNLMGQSVNITNFSIKELKKDIKDRIDEFVFDNWAENCKLELPYADLGNLPRVQEAKIGPSPADGEMLYGFAAVKVDEFFKFAWCWYISRKDAAEIRGYSLKNLARIKRADL